jgi:hypothetical protein
VDSESIDWWQDTKRKCCAARWFFVLIAVLIVVSTVVYILVVGEYLCLRKATIASSYLSVCSPAWYNSTPTGRIFMKFDI